MHKRSSCDFAEIWRLLWWRSFESLWIHKHNRNILLSSLRFNPERTINALAVRIRQRDRTVPVPQLHAFYWLHTYRDTRLNVTLQITDATEVIGQLPVLQADRSRADID